ncbi:MAG: aminomethyl-transferring glycine dehydrogenase subunit GcvPA [Alphaproteobacteria bacterium]|nr:aminomethyl-transferring glycine dehydrogenase subunit GcvPA [Alphaproteobacteria bacterium]
MRYLPLTSSDLRAMMDKIGIKDCDDLYAGLPTYSAASLDLPDHQTELQVERIMTRLAAQNHAAVDGPFFLGAGCYHHHIPATVDYIIQRSEFLTSYTPYQPEMAQGTLQVIYEFQTMIAMITGMDVANASMYDGATACAEAALMAQRITGRKLIALAGHLHPQYLEVIKTYLGESSILPQFTEDEGGNPEGIAAIIVPSPDYFGTPQDIQNWRKKCDAMGAKLIYVTNEILSLGLLPAPVEADIVCGEAQSIGVPMSFGGPHLGFFACKQDYVRQMPGRLCGETVDMDGRRSYVLTLSTREQHIRREKATSNICTNQGLCALAFTVHMALLGEHGFRHLARLNHQKACDLADALASIEGIKIRNDHFFNEFVVEFGPNFPPADHIIQTLAAQKIIAGVAIAPNQILMAATEMTTDEDIKILCAHLADLKQ